MKNRATLIGYVGQDPEIRTTEGGREIANFRLATSERWTDKQSGDKRERTEWHRIAVFNKGLVGIIKKYVTKGSKVEVEGVIRNSEYEDGEGIKRYSTDICVENYNGSILLLDGAPSDAASQS